ncbi:Chromodomain-helicase-DNA-binding protein 3 [Morella rubra]|uniref:Chromodomain-helicase-DNA-binding protein 3 n=1 Tax=Morella rubra TaxID=262757 RepID=A0A6A1VT74_9ROSI|nr:Chromodomain-helicase-DNA-binding protein 3 [Morella rubra]
MTYKLRERRSKDKIYFSSSSSDGDSIYSDPDYSSTRPRREPQQNMTNHCNLQQATYVHMVELDVSSSNRRRRRGRRHKKRVHKGEMQSNQVEKISRRKRAPYSLKRSATCVKRDGKRTILSWLMDLEIIDENEEVWYMQQDDNHDRKLLRGFIRRAGILCACCMKEITVLEFEVHAKSDQKRPYVNIFLVHKCYSLLECLLEASTKDMKSKHSGFNRIDLEMTTVDKNDDVCMICADGGDLICCENCPSTFHVDCMCFKSIPQDDWLCPYCVCKYCGLLGNGDDELLSCSQCKRKFHWGCYLEDEMDLNISATPFSLSNGTLVNYFCGQSCIELFEHLEGIVGARYELDGGFSWSLIRHTDLRSAASCDTLQQILECNCKIALVWEMMDESFRTILDRFTNVNVVQSVIFNRGSNLTRINFEGFYTAILEKDEEIISAASLRIHGKQITEMPFVVTREEYRHKGIWRKLLAAIESLLCSLNVGYLVIPSIEDLVTMWTEKCGFKKLANPPESDGGEAMEVDEVGNRDNSNGVDPEQNRAYHTIQNEMEIDEAKNTNSSRMGENGTNLGRQNLKKPRPRPLLDLNLKPLEEEDEILMPMQEQPASLNGLNNHQSTKHPFTKNSGPSKY